MAGVATMAMTGAVVGAGRLQLHGARPTLSSAPQAQAPVVPPSASPMVPTSPSVGGSPAGLAAAIAPAVDRRPEHR